MSKNTAKSDSSVKRINVQKSCFDGGDAVTFYIWIPRFLAELNSKKALDLVAYEGIPGALDADGAPVETPMGFARPCPVGEEEAYVQAQIDSQIAAVNATVEANIAVIQGIPANQMNAAARNLETARITMKANDEIMKINNSRSSINKDLENSIALFEKREEAFNQKVADAVKVFYSMLCSGPLAVVEPFLKEGRPRAAFHALNVYYKAGIGGQQISSLVMTKLQNYRVDLKEGSLSEHMSAIKNLAHVWEGGGINQPLDETFLMNGFLESLGNHSDQFKDEVKHIRMNNLTWEQAKLKLQERESILVAERSSSKKQHPKEVKMDNIHSLLTSALTKVVKSLKRPRETAAAAASEVAAASGGSPQKKTQPTCTKCGKRGHEAGSCWSDMTCPKCRAKGHIEKFCPVITGKPFGSPAKANPFKVTSLLPK